MINDKQQKMFNMQRKNLQQPNKYKNNTRWMQKQRKNRKWIQQEKMPKKIEWEGAAQKRIRNNL